MTNNNQYIDGFEHYMLKEIHDQPKALFDTFNKRIDRERVVLDELPLSVEQLKDIDRIHIVACGTAYHAGLVGKLIFEKLTGIPVETAIASEYRYLDPIIKPNTLVIVVSQSGETNDTLAALREAKRQGAPVLAITNVVDSTIAREADFSIPTWAGREVAIASTKAYTCQLIVFYLLAIYFAQKLGTYSAIKLQSLIEAIQLLPDQVTSLLKATESIKRTAEHIAKHESLFFLGRGLDYAVALEGSLKLKETTYIHSEAYPAGEFKHGSMALVTDGVPIIAVATQSPLLDRMTHNVKELVERGAYVIGIHNIANSEFSKTVQGLFTVPQTNDFLTPVLSVIPMQLLAYYTSLARGIDVDKPRNLTKSVTAE